MTHGFELIDAAPIPEIGCDAQHYRHRDTGAEALMLRHDDPVHSFSIAFRTPPPDDTGVAHILEHCVLSGSRRYPLRKPFVELLKGSLQCYLNASTEPGLTIYPVASPHEADFRNLVAVYLDAVFFPLLTDDAFRQEGWRAALPRADGAVTLTGVVLNEMLGAVSSPVAVLENLRRRTLFPDTSFGACHGGDPAHIPDLDAPAMRRFHARHYRPGNALAVFCGPGGPNDRLEMLGAVLERAGDGGATAVAAPRPSRFDTPRRQLADAGVSGGQVALTWGLRDLRGTDAEILAELLLGSPSAPLRAALARAFGGVDLVLPGLGSDADPPYFGVALAPLDPGRAMAVETCVLETLKRIARDGVDRELALAAIARVETRRSLHDDPLRPAGIVHGLRAARGWQRGASPLRELGFTADCGALRSRVLSGEKVFERMLRHELIDNPHRVTLGLAPAAAAPGRAALDRRRRALEDGLRPAARRALLAATRRDARAVDRPDPPEVLALLPRLSSADLPRLPPARRVETLRLGPVTVLSQPSRCAGLVHLDLGFDLCALPATRLPWAGLLRRALTDGGGGAFEARVARLTGGIEALTWSGDRTGGGAAARLILRGTARPGPGGFADLLALLRELLLPALPDGAALVGLVGREILRLESALVPRGHETVDRLLRAQIGAAGAIDDSVDGLGYLRFLKALRQRLAQAPEPELVTLHAVQRQLLRSTPICSLAADDGVAEALLPLLREFCAAFSGPGATMAPPPCLAPIGLALPSETNFVGRGFDLRAAAGVPSGATAVAATHLALNLLWPELRSRGGAYGALCRVCPTAGTLRLLSYRDPQLLATLDCFDGAGDWLARRIAAPELERCVIGALGQLDRPRPVRAAALAMLTEHLSGDTDRLSRRDELLDATLADLRRTAEALRAAAPQRHVAVLGGRTALEMALERRPGLLSLTEP